LLFETKNNEEAFDNYNKAKKALDKNPNPRALGEWYNNMGLYFKAIGKNNEVVKSWQSAIETFKSIDDKFGLTDTTIYLAEYYLEKMI
jgi:tetratricopeptide (TPR) repeat protein